MGAKRLKNENGFVDSGYKDKNGTILFVNDKVKCSDGEVRTLEVDIPKDIILEEVGIAVYSHLDVVRVED